MLAGLSGQFVALSFLVLVPLVYTEQLPLFRITDLHILPPVGRLERPAPIEQPAASPQREHAAPSVFRLDKLVAPVAIPKQTPDIIDPPSVAIASELGPYVPGALSDPHGLSIGIPAPAIRIPGPAPRPDVREPVKAAVEMPGNPVPVGGKVQEAKILHRVIPTYPQLARQVHVSGTVQLVGIIGTDGRIKELRVIKGHPLLVQAALDAVKQWVYRPTLLNDRPVEVIAPIDVHFTLIQ